MAKLLNARQQYLRRAATDLKKKDWIKLLLFKNEVQKFPRRPSY